MAGALLEATPRQAGTYLYRARRTAWLDSAGEQLVQLPAQHFGAGADDVAADTGGEALVLELLLQRLLPRYDAVKMTLKASIADGLPFGPPHTGLERMVFRAPAYKRVDIGMSYRLLDNEDGRNQRSSFATCVTYGWVWTASTCSTSAT